MTLGENAKTAAEAAGKQVEIVKVTDSVEIADNCETSAPGLVVVEKVLIVSEIGRKAVTEYRIQTCRISNYGRLAVAKKAELVLDTDKVGGQDSMNPVELLLSAFAYYKSKGIERVTPMLTF